MWFGSWKELINLVWLDFFCHGSDHKGTAHYQLQYLFLTNLIVISRVSYLEVKFDDETVKTRNSGLCISTGKFSHSDPGHINLFSFVLLKKISSLKSGTGSTSWTFNINKLTHQSVEQLLRIVYETTHFPVNWKDDRLVEAVTQKFNNEIVFDPEDNKMAYTLRDPVSAGTFPGKISTLLKKIRHF